MREYHVALCPQVTLVFEITVLLQSPGVRLLQIHLVFCLQITKGATAEERLEWNLPEGAEYRWLPNAERNLLQRNPSGHIKVGDVL